MSDGSAKILKQNEVQDSVRNRKGLSYINVREPEQSGSLYILNSILHT